MNQYITGTAIKGLREQRKMTQLQLAEILGVSEKTVSKWETMRGLPDMWKCNPQHGRSCRSLSRDSASACRG